MQISRYADPTVLLELRSEMSHLADASDDNALLYKSFEYLDAYSRTFSDRTYQVYTASEGGRIAAVAMFSPACANGQDVLRFAGEGLWGYTGATCARSEDVDALAELLRTAVVKGGCANLEIGPLHASQLAPYLAAVNKLSLPAQAFKIAGGAPFIDTRTVDRSAWLKSLKKAAYSDSLRCEKRLAELGKVSLFKLDNASATPEQIQHAMALFLRMYHRQWPENRFKKEARWEDFYRRFALGSAQAGMLEFAFLTLDDRPVAAHYGFVHKGRRYYFTPTYDLDYGKYSPGKILLRYLIDASFDQGVIFDFQNDLESYKLDWSTAVADRFVIKLLPH